MKFKIGEVVRCTVIASDSGVARVAFNDAEIQAASSDKTRKQDFRILGINTGTHGLAVPKSYVIHVNDPAVRSWNSTHKETFTVVGTPCWNVHESAMERIEKTRCPHCYRGVSRKRR